jgi:hypothetical protein
MCLKVIALPDTFSQEHPFPAPGVQHCQPVEVNLPMCSDRHDEYAFLWGGTRRGRRAPNKPCLSPRLSGPVNGL